MSSEKNHATGFPVAPAVFAGAAAIGAILHVFWPIPWIGSPLGDILLAIGAIGSALLDYLAVKGARMPYVQP